MCFLGGLNNLYPISNHVCLFLNSLRDRLRPDNLGLFRLWGKVYAFFLRAGKLLGDLREEEGYNPFTL